MERRTRRLKDDEIMDLARQHDSSGPHDEKIVCLIGAELLAFAHALLAAESLQGLREAHTVRNEVVALLSIRKTS